MSEPGLSIPADLSSGRIRQFRDADTTGVIRLRLAKSPGIGSRSSRLIIIGVKSAGVYNLVMPVAYDFCSTQFDDAVRAAGRNAFAETLAAGLPVFYIDAGGLNVLERGDGRRFEIHWLPGAPSGENYEIIRELTAHAA